MSNANPFTFGAMITDPNRFIGRRAELEIITARLNGSQPQGSAVVGPRRIGKSSLLHYLYQPRTDETVRAAANQRVLYLDAQQGECATPEAFRRTLVMALLASQPFDRRTQKGKTLDDVQTALNTNPLCPWETVRLVLENLPFHPVICLDEFEALLGDTFDNRFFDALRNWANEGLLTWITASALPLSDLGRQHNHTSPFFNLLATVTLKELTDSEATELLDQANVTSYAFTPQERRMLRSLASNHPYHLQIVAWKLWEEKAHNRPPSRKALATFLCQQPNPPVHCKPRPPLHPGWKATIGLGVIALLLAGTITWRDPVWVSGVISACWTGLQPLLSYADEVGNIGQIIGGILFLIVGISVVVAGIKQRKRLSEIIRTLWEKWTP
ncbi:MAG: ATP-binding protein [Caldilineaceae bacterium]